MPRNISLGHDSIALHAVSVRMPVWEEKWRNCFSKRGIKVVEENAFSVNGIIVDSIAGCDTRNDEAYAIHISRKRINVEAISEKGFYWALMTLEQLFDDNSNVIPVCEIIDWPAFPVRGFMMDVGRTYVSTEEIKREIEIMSRFKMNVYHLHLTENQAWRLGSDIFPQLNDSVNMTRCPGKFYSIEQCKEIERWASSHNMILIPEIDMPGHSAAFERTFGVGIQTVEGKAILKQLIEEACSTFANSVYIHIGTDEVKFTDPSFVGEMVDFIRARDKKAISWNPGWNYNSGEIDMTHLWSFRGRVQPGIRSIDSRFHYINHYDIYSDIRALYRSSIYGKECADEEIAGMILALWNDRYVDNEQHLIADNNVYPLLLAGAERSWIGGGSEYFDKLGVNMARPGSDDYNSFAGFERRLLYHKKGVLRCVPISYVRQSNIRWLITEPFPNHGNLAMEFPPEHQAIDAIYPYNGSIYRTQEAFGGSVYLRHVWGNLMPAFFSNPEPNSTVYAMTKVFSPHDCDAGLQFETQNYSRSEADLPPPQGEWDYRKSKLWFNGIEISAPTWTSSHIEKDNEVPLANENMAVRPPIGISLKKGWNDVLIKLPVGEFTTPQTRLVKWMFTFVITTPDGSEALDNIIYSPQGNLNKN